MQSFRNALDIIILIWTVLNTILYIHSWITNKLPKTILLLALFVITLFITQVLTEYTSYYSLTNFYIVHIYFGLQFLFLGLFYRELFKPWQKKWVLIIMSTVFAILLTYYVLAPNRFFDFNLIDIFITNVPLIFFSIVHLYNMLTETRRFFYINAAVLIYLSCSSIVFFLGTFLIVEGEIMGFSEETVLNIWTINNTLYLIFLILFTVEWVKTIHKWKPQDK